jgi:FAD/FMN-containing dehydrogenase/Fe-S oxidoreductase
VQNVADFLADLDPRVAGELRSDIYSRMLYSTDASIYQVMPHAVLIPRNADDVQAAVTLAHERRIPIVPRTAGSSLAGQAIGEALIIDFSRHLDAILELNKEESWVRVQPGIVLDELNLYLKPHGLQFGPDPASSNRAAMGGIVANNSTGSHSILYGMTADHVLELDTFLSDGTAAHLGPIEHDALAQFQKRPGLEGRLYRGIADLARDNVDAILAGTPKHWRRCGGYNLDRFVDGASFRYPRDPRFNLAKMISGSEGTLAVMTELKLGVVDLPTRTGLAVVHFDSLYEALSSVPAMLETRPSAIELLDNLGLTLCRGVPQYARLLSTFVEGDPNCVLITEFRGESDAELRESVDNLQRHLTRQGVKTHTVAAIDPQLQTNVWTVRKVGLGLMMSIKGDYKPIPFIEDAAVPPQHLANYVTEIERFCKEIGTERVAMYAHASAGCLHIRPLINAKLAADVERLPKIASFAAELLGRYGGSLSSEHGDGRVRSWLNEQFFGRELYELYRQVKGLFDPAGILNPGQVVDAPPMTRDLRYGAEYKALQQPEHLDFSSDQGFDRAVEMCNGAGICRKKTEGTMCPSFMVTREEEHSTRGRANLLRAAMSGRLPAEELTGERIYEAMDLCIECKACKAECPSSVDMAKVKFEYLARYYEANPVPPRVRFFADIASASRASSGWRAPIVNALLDAAPVRRLLEKSLGISSKRTLPHFAARPFTRWFAERSAARAGRPPAAPAPPAQHNGGAHTAGPQSAANGSPRGAAQEPSRSVVLFNDTFNTYNEPQVAIAAVEVLEAAGYRVVLPGHWCCGRPMVSKGLVEQARAAARATVDKLHPLVAQGMPVVGLEPSCILTLKDEYLSLLPGDAKAQAVAEAVFTFEEFVATEAEAGRFTLQFAPDAGKVLLHGHCHQKALVGTGPSHQVLELAGYQVQEVDSGCCGMAGSFGYEAEHLEVSLAMAERRLLPAVRAADEDTVIAAAGTSCRHQIGHGCTREALHPAQILRNALSPDR